MPVISIANGVTIPLALEPDIEHIRPLEPTPPLAFHNNSLATSATIPSCSSSLTSLTQHTMSTHPFDNCSDSSRDTTGPMWVRLLLDHDVVYYVFPVMLTVGLLCDIVAAGVLICLVGSVCRKSTSSRGKSSRAAGGRCLGNIYLLWNAVSSAVLLMCCWTRRLSDYVEVEDGGLRAYFSAVDEWLSYASLWLLIAMDLEKALQLTATGSICENVPSPPVVYKSAFAIDDQTKQPGASKTFDSTSNSVSYRKEVAVCCAVYAVCFVSALPHFFSFQLVETFDMSTNRTLFLPHHSAELTDSFEYRVVYYWYIVGLTILFPVPLLVVVSIVICRALISRRRRHKLKRASPSSVQSQHLTKNGGSSTLVVVGKSNLTRRPQPSSITSGRSSSSSADSDAVALTGRLLVVTTALYLLFTLPRTVLTGMEGLPSSKWSAMLVTVDSGPRDLDVDEYSVIGDMIRSLTDFSFYLYYASALPLLCSYHDDVHALLVSLICSSCSKRRQRARYLKSIKEHQPGVGRGQIAVRKQTTKKTVKFDSRTIEIEIQC